MWKKHPKTLPFLFFSEMWERFGYYLMIGIFTLYLKDVKHGYAMTEAESADLYGTFIALVFFNAFHWRFTGRPVFRLSQIHYHGWLNDGNLGLSIVSKLSPVRITSLMMGGWFLSTSIGNKLSGVLATLWDNYNHKAGFFWLNFGLLMIAAVMCFAMLGWLNRVMKEKGLN